MSELAVLFKYYVGEFKRDWKNVPNRVTLVRLFLGPLPAIVIATGVETYRFYALIGFTILICTDSLDGFLARRLNQKTKIGRILDPIADRVISGTMLIVLIFQNYYVRPWLFFVLVCLLVSALIISMIMFKSLMNHENAEPNVAGKIKTIFLSGLLICLVGESISMFNYSLSIFVSYLVLMTLAASAFSFIEYILKYLLPTSYRYSVDCGVNTPAEDTTILLMAIFIILAVIGDRKGIDMQLLFDNKNIVIFGLTLFIVMLFEMGIDYYQFSQRLNIDD